jgi:CRP/FNR family cyclic AMP-dependent transcriptional regulator
MTDIHSYMEALMLSEERPLRFDAGQVVFKAGEPGTVMYIVRTGSVELRAGERVLETVQRGGLLGEMALIDPAPRSATAVAGPDCTLVGVDEATFHALVRQVPGFALEVMRVMARRLRHSANAP